jgi:DNA-binding beta-propeller fold protein YncE
MRTILALVVSTCSIASLAQAADAGGKYSVERTIKIGGPGRWDYFTFDPANHMLYVTRSTHEQVIDPASGKVVADFGPIGGAHGTALVPAVNRGFITDGKEAKLVVFDLKSNTVLGTVAAAEDADGIIYDAGDNLVLVACGDAAKMLACAPDVDLKTGKVQEVDLGGKPEFLAADGAGKAYVTVNDKNEIAVVDLKTMKVTSRWPTAPGTAPTGMAIDPAGKHLFVSCRSNKKMIVMSTDDGKVLADLPIGTGVDASCFDAGTGEAFASCRDGTLTVIKETSPGKFEVTQTVKTQQGAATMTIDPATHTIYLPSAEFEPATGGGRPQMKPDSFMVVVVAPAK